MEKKKVVVALGHKALGTTLPEQQVAVKNAAKAIADLVEEGCQVAISHSNAPQVGMIHTALNEFGKEHENYTFAPMSVCSAMSQGYIGYDLQNAIREELLGKRHSEDRQHHHYPGSGRSLRRGICGAYQGDWPLYDKRRG